GVGQVEQFVEEDDLVALRAGSAQAEVAGEQIAFGAATFTQEALAAGRALVDGVGGVGGEEEVVWGTAAHSRVSSATAFLAQASSTRGLPSAAAAMSAATAALLSTRGRPAAAR